MTRAHASEVEIAGPVGWRLVVEDRRVWVEREAGGGYQPAALGDWWRYVNEQRGGPTSESLDRVVAAAAVGERWVARVRSENPAWPAADSERDLVIGPEGVLADIGEMTTASGTMRTLASRGVFLPHAPRPGSKWTYAQTIAGPGVTIEVEGAAEAVGEVQVAVPAGVYTAMLVRGEVVSRVVTAAPAGTLEQRQLDESHFVRGLGLVRHVSVMASGHRIERTLHAYGVRGAP